MRLLVAGKKLHTGLSDPGAEMMIYVCILLAAKSRVRSQQCKVLNQVSPRSEDNVGNLECSENPTWPPNVRAKYLKEV
jgi:hypothetical protein